jgi:hypothetical protein
MANLTDTGMRHGLEEYHELHATCDARERHGPTAMIYRVVRQIIQLRGNQSTTYRHTIHQTILTSGSHISYSSGDVGSIQFEVPIATWPISLVLPERIRGLAIEGALSESLWAEQS